MHIIMVYNLGNIICWRYFKMINKIDRNRLIYLILIFSVILLGLGTRRFSSYLPSFIANYGGDTLWALLVFFIIGFLFNKWPTIKVATYAICFSFFIEISQLYHALWIDALRKTLLGGLILGFGFLWSDLVCYTVGIVIGVIFEKCFY